MSDVHSTGALRQQPEAVDHGSLSAPGLWEIVSVVRHGRVMWSARRRNGRRVEWFRTPDGKQARYFEKRGIRDILVYRFGRDAIVTRSDL
jgi:hypothetical protein